MFDIFKDFVNSGISHGGCGFFEKDELAIQYARKITKCQLKKFNRYKEIPGPFFSYLKAMEIIPKDTNISAKVVGRSAEGVAELLWRTPYKNEGHRDAGEYLRKMILTSRMPMLKKSYPGNHRVWVDIEEGRLKRL